MDTEQNVDADLREQLAAIEEALRELPGDAELEQVRDTCSRHDPLLHGLL